MAITQRDTHESPDSAADASDGQTWFVYCHGCDGFYPSSADDVAVGHTEESKAQNLAAMHQQSGHQTFVVPSTWLDKGTEVERRMTRG